MGLMGRILGARGAVKSASDAVGGVAEVFVGNRAKRDAAAHKQMVAALEQYGAEFELPRQGWFDRFMDSLNRLPRPLLVIGTLGLFVYAMAEPVGFSRRMEGLRLVPEPMWWLLGAIVSFYFGARELHYQRGLAGFPLPRLLSDDALTVSVRETGDADLGADAPAEATSERRALRAEPGNGVAVPPPAGFASAPAKASRRVVVRAADPHFNAAIEEWRLSRA